MVFNCRNDSAPEYLSDEITPWFPACAGPAGLRSADSAEQSNKLVVPATQTKTFGERSFRVAGPSAWNSLPSDIRMTDSKQAFQQLLKTHLFSISYPFLWLVNDFSLKLIFLAAVLFVFIFCILCLYNVRRCVIFFKYVLAPYKWQFTYLLTWTMALVQ